MNDIENYDSKEEWYFSLWLEELTSKSLIESTKYHPNSFTLSNKVAITFEMQMATKTKLKDFHLAAEHKYQADWLIYWSPLASGIMHPGKSPLKKSPMCYPFLVNWSEKKQLFYSVIDIKGSFSGPHNNSAVTFPLNQKWVYAKFGIYVQKVVLTPRIAKGRQVPADALFPNTFVPRRYLTTDNSGIARKINFKYILLQEFLSNHGLFSL